MWHQNRFSISEYCEKRSDIKHVADICKFTQQHTAEWEINGEKEWVSNIVYST